MLLQAQSKYHAGYRVFVAWWWPGMFYIYPGDGRLYSFSSLRHLLAYTPAEFLARRYTWTHECRSSELLQAFNEITDQVYSGEYDAVASTE